MTVAAATETINDNDAMNDVEQRLVVRLSLFRRRARCVVVVYSFLL
jgi:hypothetical protein